MTLSLEQQRRLIDGLSLPGGHGQKLLRGIVPVIAKYLGLSWRLTTEERKVFKSYLRDSLRPLIDTYCKHRAVKDENCWFMGELVNEFTIPGAFQKNDFWATQFYIEQIKKRFDFFYCAATLNLGKEERDIFRVILREHQQHQKLTKAEADAIWDHGSEIRYNFDRYDLDRNELSAIQLLSKRYLYSATNASFIILITFLVAYCVYHALSRYLGEEYPWTPAIFAGSTHVLETAALYNKYLNRDSLYAIDNIPDRFTNDITARIKQCLERGAAPQVSQEKRAVSTPAQSDSAHAAAAGPWLYDSVGSSAVTTRNRVRPTKYRASMQVEKVPALLSLTPSLSTPIVWRYKGKELVFDPDQLNHEILEVWTVNPALKKWNKVFYLYWPIDDSDNNFEKRAAGTPPTGTMEIMSRLIQVAHLVPPTGHCGIVHCENNGDPQTEGAVVKVKPQNKEVASWRFLFFEGPRSETNPNARLLVADERSLVKVH